MADMNAVSEFLQACGHDLVAVWNALPPSVTNALAVFLGARASVGKSLQQLLQGHRSPESHHELITKGEAQ